MPTVITHAVVGTAVASLRRRSVSPLKLAVVASGLAVLPDVDVLGFRYGIAYGDVFGHRGFTHSVAFAAVAAIVCTLVFFREHRLTSTDFRVVASLLFLATASHGVLDAFTNAGLGVGFLIPFDDTRYFWPWRPLTASPLSVSRFLSGSGVDILLNEMKWVGPPVVALVTAAWLARKFRR